MTAPQDPFAAPGQPGGTPAGSPQPPQEQGGPGYGGPSGGGPGYGGAGAPAPAYGGGGGYASAQAGPRNGFGLTALITGIVGLLFGVLPFTFYLGIVLGIVAVVFAGWGAGGPSAARRRTAARRWPASSAARWPCSQVSPGRLRSRSS